MINFEYIKEQIRAKVSLTDLTGSYKTRTSCPSKLCEGENCQIFDSDTWHCYKCKLSGDIFSWVSISKNISYSQALKELAGLAGVNLEPNPTRTFLLEHLLTKSREYLQQHPEKLDYLVNSRKISKACLERHEIGYIDLEGQVLEASQISEGILSDLGLLYHRYNGETYSHLAGRYIIPIRDVKGRLVSLKGRANPLECDESKKSLPLKADSSYGRHSHMDHLYLENKIESYGDWVYLCEGEPDTLTLRDQGLPALGLMTNTGLYKHHHKLAKFKTIYVVLDNDQATKRLILDELYKLQVKIPDTKIINITIPGDEKTDVNDLWVKQNKAISTLEGQEACGLLIDQWSEEFKSNREVSSKVYNLLRACNRPEMIARLSSNIQVSPELIRFAMSTS